MRIPVPDSFFLDRQACLIKPGAHLLQGWVVVVDGQVEPFANDLLQIQRIQRQRGEY